MGIIESYKTKDMIKEEVTEQNQTNETQEQIVEKKNPIAKILIEEYGTVEIELYPDMAPNTVANFISLVNEGYYQNYPFDRIVKDFTVQCGMGDEDFEYSINGEFAENGYTNNTLKFERGTVGLSRADYTNYATDEDIKKEGFNSGFASFFITLKEEPELDGIYAPFGKVTQGMEIIDKISKIATESQVEGGENSKPLNPPIIKYITVDTFGINYPTPERKKKFDFMNWLYQQYGMIPSE